MADVGKNKIGDGNIDIKLITPYKKNAKKHPTKQIQL